MRATRSPLLVIACGMTTAVGLTAPSSCAAIRARIDGFKETRFMTRGGKWIIGAEVPLDEPWRGLRRLAHLIANPISECLDAMPDLRAEDVPVLLGVAEPDRLGRPGELEQNLLQLVQEILGVRFHDASRLIPMGRVSGAIGIREASKLVNEQQFQRVIVAGVDSYLLARTLKGFDARRRLLTDDNSNGFIPGEAGAAVLVGPDSGAPGLAVLSLGLAVEKATIDSEEPLRGEGLAAAYKQALEAAKIGLHEIDYRMADLSGEQYWFKESALALTRVMRVRREVQDIWHPADCVGETGAGATPLMLGYALWAAQRGFAPGPRVLVQAANDDGRRVALVLDASDLV